ncbi:DMT family transporter [Vibrio fortis]|uniref:DMT family transporter n=1 Tax=Vibrio fortis TaxID=212667 RepID=UPI0038CD7B9A
MLLGYTSIAVTLMIWASFFLSLKGGANSVLAPADIAMTRFLIPSLVLFPLVYKARRAIASVPIIYLIGMFIGCGLPYLLVTSSAMQYVPVAQGSALVPGTLPLFVTMIAVFFFKQPLSHHRIIGFALVIIGIVIFLFTGLSMHEGHTSDLLIGSETLGQLLFLFASLMWAIFTISARVANLNALVVAGLISLMSSILLIALIVAGVLPSYLYEQSMTQWPVNELLTHSAIQGVGAGIIAAATYLYAVQTLGAERSAAFGSSTPVIATLLAIPIFHEVPSVSSWVSLALICSGSLLASNIFLKKDASLDYEPPKRHA